MLQDKFKEKLELMGEDSGAKWVKGICISMKCLESLVRGCATDNWSGDLGRYTLAHSKGPG